jgi:predicted transcriptional regulator
MLYTFAKLTPEQLAKLQAYEAKHQQKVLALTEVRVDVETLSKKQVEELQALEKELGTILLVVK